MDRVIVAGHGLERGEIGLGNGAARDIETVAEFEILKEFALREAVFPPVEWLAHGNITASSAKSRAMAASS
jgi:hypothetical protein